MSELEESAKVDQLVQIYNLQLGNSTGLQGHNHTAKVRKLVIRTRGKEVGRKGGGETAIFLL